MVIERYHVVYFLKFGSLQMHVMTCYHYKPLNLKHWNCLRKFYYYINEVRDFFTPQKAFVIIKLQSLRDIM